MSLRELCERTFSVDGNSGPIAAWRRAISAAVDGGGGGGGGAQPELLLEWGKQSVPPNSAFGTQQFVARAVGVSFVEDPLDVVLNSIPQHFVPPGQWTIVSATLWLTAPSAGAINNYAILNGLGNPIATRDNVDSSNGLGLDMIVPEPTLLVNAPGDLFTATVESPTEDGGTSRNALPLIALLLRRIP